MSKEEEVNLFRSTVFDKQISRMFYSLVPENEIIRSAKFEGLDNDNGQILMYQNEDYPLPQDFDPNEMNDVAVDYVVNEPYYLNRHKN